MNEERKNPRSDLRKYYTVLLEAGVVVALGICLIAMKVNIHRSTKKETPHHQQQVVKMKHVKQTEQKKKPPPPPHPQVPVSVPNNKILKNPDIHFDVDLNNENNTHLPAPPKEHHQGNTKKSEEHVFMAVGHMPKLKGGITALQKKVKYPESCRDAGIQGRVTLQFVVNKKGIPEDIHVVRGIGGGCDKAAVEAVKKYARFTPGRQRGTPVKVQYSLPIVFRLRH